MVIPIVPASVPVYSADGKEMKLPSIKPRGSLSISCKIPVVFSNICGWFRWMHLDYFGEIIGEKVWVEVCNGSILLYDSPYGGKVIQKIECKTICDVQEIMYDKLEIKLEAISVQCVPEDDSLVGNSYVLGWNDDKLKLRGSLFVLLLFTASCS